MKEHAHCLPYELCAAATQLSARMLEWDRSHGPLVATRIGPVRVFFLSDPKEASRLLRKGPDCLPKVCTIIMHQVTSRGRHTLTAQWCCFLPCNPCQLRATGRVNSVCSRVDTFGLAHFTTRKRTRFTAWVAVRFLCSCWCAMTPLACAHPPCPPTGPRHIRHIHQDDSSSAPQRPYRARWHHAHCCA